MLANKQKFARKQKCFFGSKRQEGLQPNPYEEEKGEYFKWQRMLQLLLLRQSNEEPEGACNLRAIARNLDLLYTRVNVFH